MKINKKNIKKIINYFLKKIYNNSKKWKFTIILNNTIKSSAEIKYWYNKGKFKIIINPKRQNSQKELMDTILHELLHIFFAPYTDLAEELVKYPKLHKWNNKEKAIKLREIEEIIVRKLTKIILKED